jgi:hypothetical protein
VYFNIETDEAGITGYQRKMCDIAKKIVVDLQMSDRRGEIVTHVCHM